jgi:hypothetical protein
MLTRIAIALSCLTVTLSACAPHAVPTRDPRPPANVAVTNNFDEPVTVYVVTARGVRQRIGTIMQGSTARMVIPAEMLADFNVQLVADPVGPRPQFTFPRMTIEPGTQLELVLERHLAASSVWVR